MLQRRDDNLPRQHASVQDDGRGDASDRRVVLARRVAAHAGRRARRAPPLRDRPCASETCGSNRS